MTIFLNIVCWLLLVASLILMWEALDVDQYERVRKMRLADGGEMPSVRSLAWSAVFCILLALALRILTVWVLS
jgi:uncharacterized membrane protein